MTFTIYQQIEEFEREIALRKNVYPNLVAKGNMRQSVADYHMARIEAALKSLEWLRDNRDGIVKAMKEQVA